MSWLPFVTSAALVAFAIQLALTRPLTAAIVITLSALVLAPQLLARRRARRLLMSGDIPAVLAAWNHALDRVPHPETMVPLVRATAFAAYGLTEPARAALERARRGPAWEAALEQRLFVETLLDAFEGERESAVQKAAVIERLPLPPAGPVMRARIAGLRAAVGALARAFARSPRAGDVRVLETAARGNPLVFWAMQYAAAVVHVERGAHDRARQILAKAPAWPESSAFNHFDAELRALLQ